MRRKAELTYLLPILLVISLGFLLLMEGVTDRNLPATVLSRGGLQDIFPCLITTYPNFLLPLYFVVAFLLFHAFLRVRLPEADPLILPAIALLSGIGLIMMLRLSPDLALTRYEAVITSPQFGNKILTLAQLGVKQCFLVISGILAAISAIYLFSDRLFSLISSKKYLWVLISMLLITVTMTFGTKINGKTLWLFGTQPVELVKLMMIFFMSGYIYEKGKGISAATQVGVVSWFRYGAPFVTMCIFAVLPIVKQGDLGPSVLMLIIFILLFFYAGNSCFITLSFAAIIGAVGFACYHYGSPHVVRERVDILLDPFGKSENMARVLWSISSGGLWGAGIGYGQPFRIPEVQSDFNFAAICEEMGLMGAASVVLAYAVLIHRCFRIAAGTANGYQRTLVLGIATLIGVQAFVIISANLNCTVLTGITLPFVSHGGSSMIVTFIMAGIILKVSGGKR